MTNDTHPKPYATNHGRHAPSSTEVPLVAIGVVTAAHGIRGQVKLRSFTSDPYALLDYAPLLNASGTQRFDITIDAETKTGLIASIKGITTRNAAEALKGTQLYIEKSRLPAAGEEEYYYDDLIGLEIRAATHAAPSQGEVLGHVVAVYDFGAGDILEIRLASGQKEMYPFTREIFPEVQVKQGYILAQLPEIIEAKGSPE